MWKTEPDAVFADLDRPDAIDETELSPTLLHYEDGYHYQNVLAPLVKMEADYDKQMKESLAEESISVRWEKSLTGRNIATFTFSGRHSAELSRVVVGDELRIKLGTGAEFLHGSPWEGVGYIKNIIDGEVELELKPSVAAGGHKGSGGGRRHGKKGGGGDGNAKARQKVPEQITDDYIVSFIWKATSFDRMQNALKTFAIDDTSVTGYIYHKLLGHPVEEQLIANPKLPDSDDFTAPGLPPLNESQVHAVAAVLQRPMSLIQGPPGTGECHIVPLPPFIDLFMLDIYLNRTQPTISFGSGKTVTCATLVYHLTRQNMGQVLVTAPSNVAVDQLTEKIAATGLRVVRLASKTREATSSSVDHLCLHIMTPLAAGDEFNKLQCLKNEVGELTERDQKKYQALRNRTEREILQAADVICCTCVGAGDPRLKNFRFRQVVIDEATQAIEAEALIPLSMGAKQIVFVGESILSFHCYSDYFEPASHRTCKCRNSCTILGDHCQLGPVVMCKAAAKAGLTQSMFERLVLIGIRPIRLQVQYRMHPILSEFPSNMFYEGSLQNGVTESDRQLRHMPGYTGKDEFPWPIKNKPMFFWSVAGMEEISASGTSYLNRTEASYVEKIVTHLLKMGVDSSQIGCITPYDGQKKYVQEHMRRSGPLAASVYEAIEVNSVDAFQGREKEIILVSCVRSSESQGIGFLSDPRRLNVALTRARVGLVLLGNPRVLSKNPLWAALLLHFKEHETLVEGPLNNLQQSFMTFARPRRNISSDQRYAFTALARGGWDGRWEDRGHRYRNAPGFENGGGGRHGRRKGRQTDSRFDPCYEYTSYNDAGGNGVPLPSFAPLPDYAHGDEGSVGGSVYTNGSQWSRGGGYYSNDMRSQADSASVTSSRY